MYMYVYSAGLCMPRPDLESLESYVCPSCQKAARSNANPSNDIWKRRRKSIGNVWNYQVVGGCKDGSTLFQCPE